MKISLTNCSRLLYPMRRLRKEEYLKKTENLDSARTWRLESQWHVTDSHSTAVCCCSRPMVGLFYKAVPVLADEDKIGGSALLCILEETEPRRTPPPWWEGKGNGHHIGGDFRCGTLRQRAWRSPVRSLGERPLAGSWVPRASYGRLAASDCKIRATKRRRRLATRGQAYCVGVGPRTMHTQEPGC